MYFLITSAVTVSPPSGRNSHPPKTPRPTVAWHLRICLPNLFRTDRLEQPHYFPNRVSRRKTQKQMHMIVVDLQFLDLKAMMRRNLLKQLCDPLPNRPLQDLLAILRRPHQMIAGVVHTVAGSLDRHPPNCSESVLPPAARIFHPRPTGRDTKYNFRRRFPQRLVRQRICLPWVTTPYD